MQLRLTSCVFFVLLTRYSHQYRTLTVETDDLCSPMERRRIRVDKGGALIVTQTRLNDHFEDWEINFQCKFRVVASSSKEGIIAVIQHISFRKRSTTEECIDYVQFSRNDGSTSPRFCGRFNAALKMDHNFANPTEPISSGTAFVDEKGELDVIIKVSREKLKSEEETDISIVFTSYKNCGDVFKRDLSYRPCSNKKKEFCINSVFFNDSYINCPLPDCVDEKGCSKSSDIVDYYYGNKVLIGAVSSVFVVFALFILCLWVCKTYKIFCWARNFADPGSTTPQSHPSEAPRVIELNEQTGARSSHSQSNTTSTNNIDEDKDLPPSYDSLFPSR